MKRIKLLFLLVFIFTSFFPASDLEAEEKYVYFDVQKADPSFFSSNVPVTTNEIKLTFTRKIKRGEGEIVFTGNGTGVSFTEKIDGNVLTLMVNEPLKYRTYYGVTLKKNAILNAEDNSKSTLPDNYTYSFSTPFLSDAELAKQLASENQIQTQAFSISSQSSIKQNNLQNSNSQQSSQEIILIEKGKSITYKINDHQANYAVWVSDSKLAHAQVQNGHLVINGIGEGSIQVAIRNTVSQKKVVLNVKVVNSVLNL